MKQSSVPICVSYQSSDPNESRALMFKYGSYVSELYGAVSTHAMPGVS